MQFLDIEQNHWNTAVFFHYTGIIIIIFMIFKSFMHLWPFSKSKFNLSLTASTLLHRLVLQSVCFIYPMTGRYSTNWDRKSWPGSEIQMYYGCPCFGTDEMLLTSWLKLPSFKIILFNFITSTMCFLHLFLQAGHKRLRWGLGGLSALSEPKT